MAPGLMLSARENLHPQQGEAAGTAKESPGGQDLGRELGKTQGLRVKRTWFGNQGLNWVDYVDWILFKYMILIYSVLTRY